MNALASLQVRLPLLIAAVIGAVVLMALLVAYREFEQQLVIAAGERASAAAAQVAGLLERAAQQSTEGLRQVARHPTLAAYVAHPTPETRQAAEQWLAPLAATGPRRIEVWSDAGDRLLEIAVPSAQTGAAAPVTLPPATRPAGAGVGALHVMDGIVFSDFVVDILTPSTPPDGPAPRTRRGYLGLRSAFAVNPPGIFNRLIGSEATISIGTAGGTWTDLSRSIAAPPIDLAREGTAEYRGPDTTRRLGALARPRGTPWIVWVEFPRSVILAPASRFLRRVTLVALLFVAIGVVLAAIVSVRITRPIRELVQAADAISAGDLARRVSFSRSDEIGRLGEAFNAMVDIRLKNLAVEEESRRVHEISRLKSEFVANMSHELRTPLNVIIGFAELMHHGKVGPVSTRHKEYLADILGSSTHLLRLINDVLDLAKVESGTMELHSEPVDLQQLVATVRDMLRELAGAKQLRVDTAVDAGAAAVVIDHARLTQILYNYLSNAIKFTPAGGRVAIRVVSAGPSFVRIDVEDTGGGIAAGDLGKLFVEFQQLDSGVGEGHQGTGLGLALSKKLAEAMGGRVEVASTLGSGSTFSVVIPRSPVASRPGASHTGGDA